MIEPGAELAERRSVVVRMTHEADDQAALRLDKADVPQETIGRRVVVADRHTQHLGVPRCAPGRLADGEVDLNVTGDRGHGRSLPRVVEQWPVASESAEGRGRCHNSGFATTSLRSAYRTFGDSAMMNVWMSRFGRWSTQSGNRDSVSTSRFLVAAAFTSSSLIWEPTMH